MVVAKKFGRHYGIMGRTFEDCTGFIMGCVGAETKVRKESDLSDLWSTKYKKSKDKGIKVYVNM